MEDCAPGASSAALNPKENSSQGGCKDSPETDKESSECIDLSTLWNAWIQNTVTDLEELGREMSGVWRDLQTREDEAQQRLQQLYSDVSTLKQMGMDKVESLAHSLMTAVADISK